MLKRLRLKFILANMTIVTVMLGVIFGLLYYFTCRNLERESLQMMNTLTRDHRQIMLPSRDEPEWDVRLPYFSVQFDSDGEIISVEGEFFDLSDETELQTLVQEVLDNPKQTAVLKNYRLRYLRTETPFGQRILFADISSEQSTLRGLVKTSAIIGGLAFLLFLLISILLSRWAVKPVEEAWKQQKQFVADASHELKTPLTVILTDTELLQAPGCPEGDRKMLTESIDIMSRQMRGLVENLLELARIDNGTVKDEVVAVSFSDIVSETVMTFEPVFFEKGLPLQSELEPDIRINGIPSHLKQLISILLDNAGKYAAPGGETIVRLTRCGHRQCLLEVSDRGEKIPDEDLKNLFKRFYRADKARAMNHSYGLGLSIAQSIAAEHRGKIRAESSDGFNRFFVELPCME